MMWLLTGVMKHFLLIGLFALVCGCAHQPVVPAPVSFEPMSLVWSSLRDEFVEEVPGSSAWLEATSAGLAPKFVLHGDVVQELCGPLGLPTSEVVVPLDEDARLQLLGLLRDDTPAKVPSRTVATLNEALRIFTVTVLFEKQEYSYTIDPIFGFVDVCIGGKPVLYSENMPLSEKFVELYARQMHDERLMSAIKETRRKFYPTEATK